LAVPATFTISRKGAALMPFGRENVVAWLYNILKKSLLIPYNMSSG